MHLGLQAGRHGARALVRGREGHDNLKQWTMEDTVYSRGPLLRARS